MPVTSMCQPSAAALPRSVNMGQIVAATNGEQLQSVLGSCVGLVLHHAAARHTAMAHIVLPSACGRTASPGKFADTAVPHMTQLFEGAGLLRTGLVAKLIGGASMFGGDGPMAIGESNIKATIEALAQARIKLVAQHVGGHRGRRVIIDGGTGKATVEILGNPPVTL